MRRVKIGENSPYPLYIPKEFADKGFVGETDIIDAANMIGVIHPKATLDEAALSALAILIDLNARRGLETNVTTKPVLQQGEQNNAKNK